jgi:hypothetical protein
VLGTVDRFGPSLPPYLVVHGLVLTLWFVFFVAQTLFVSTGRTVTHRKIGVAGGVLAFAVVASSLVTMHHLVPRVAASGGDPYDMRVVGVVVSDFGVLIVFSALTAAAIYFRRRPATHKQLMLLASVMLIGPALATGRPVGRVMLQLLPPDVMRPSVVFIALSVVAMAWYDLVTTKRIQPATMLGTVLIVAAIAITNITVLGGSGAAFARWFAGIGT